MVEMTVLHIASPFSFSAPISASPPSASTGNGGQQLDASRSAAAQAAAPRDKGVVDARDARVTLSRSVDFASPATESAPSQGSLVAVLAAYGHGGSAPAGTPEATD